MTTPKHFVGIWDMPIIRHIHIKAVIAWMAGDGDAKRSPLGILGGGCIIPHYMDGNGYYVPEWMDLCEWGAL